ncbi:hypothetical protein TRIATDRAFT_85750 [Trichoderma atroviride IMI 206040]|uniref:Uncharacterized protein n=1 Tax=Hypocrea atroviridis (strain ATCC 20476 / IMI 206040) TaxID=452589 RepID=G9P265_HYPAI|nr:uncharacterized protein TRIATDRAFT_85750 [Trichoderma atroviride IMI 206040]EHK43437.1 hypothetical protein TRIATDRAFT_85750 [Trichoderma atroviride IMI 206040]
MRHKVQGPLSDWAWCGLRRLSDGQGEASQKRLGALLRKAAECGKCRCMGQQAVNALPAPTFERPRGRFQAPATLRHQIARQQTKPHTGPRSGWRQQCDGCDGCDGRAAAAKEPLGWGRARASPVWKFSRDVSHHQVEKSLQKHKRRTPALLTGLLLRFSSDNSGIGVTSYLLRFRLFAEAPGGRNL